MTAPAIQSLILKTEADTAHLAAQFAAILRTGDTLLLEGEIGAGKSAFARALIRHMAGAEIDVPSPTFTLVQTYDLPQAEVWHCDLYRLTHPDEVLELGLEDAFATAICLIEWPDRLGDNSPKQALTLCFQAKPDHHTVDVLPHPGWADRLVHFYD